MYKPSPEPGLPLGSELFIAWLRSLLPPYTIARLCISLAAPPAGTFVLAVNPIGDMRLDADCCYSLFGNFISSPSLYWSVLL